MDGFFQSFFLKHVFTIKKHCFFMCYLSDVNSDFTCYQIFKNSGFKFYTSLNTFIVSIEQPYILFSLFSA